LNDYINDLEKLIIKGCELTVFLFDVNTTNFHQYEFDYLSNSKLSPRKWLLNNMLYSITCVETRENMDGMFNEILGLLHLMFTK
ncbi:MAG: hypothetical protein MUO21_00930, partial [Nitrososphaeraceae archaeon]|nr:hypothetical protein [Nitrososphaeraceae archaeon]